MPKGAAESITSTIEAVHALSLIGTGIGLENDRRMIVRLAAKDHAAGSGEYAGRLAIALNRTLHTLAEAAPFPPIPARSFEESGDGGWEAIKVVRGLEEQAAAQEHSAEPGSPERRNARATRGLLALAEMALNGWRMEIGPGKALGQAALAKVIAYAEMTLSGANANVSMWRQQEPVVREVWADPNATTLEKDIEAFLARCAPDPSPLVPEDADDGPTP